MNDLSASDSQLLREINDNVNRMHVALFGVNGDPGFIADTRTVLGSHSKRVGFLEKWLWMLTGGGAVVAFLVAHHLIFLDL